MMRHRTGTRLRPAAVAGFAPPGATAGTVSPVGDHPVVPDYGGACIANVVPALLEPGSDAPAWFPAAALEADQVVLLVLDGLGWDQLEARRQLAPTLSGMTGGPIAS